VKDGRKNRIIKSFGSTKLPNELVRLEKQASQFIEDQRRQLGLFIAPEDKLIRSFVDSISNDDLRIVGPQLILERIYEQMGYGTIDPKGYFKHLVTCRITYPGSKLRTVDYLYRHYKINVSAQTIYRYLDKIETTLKPIAEHITFEHTKKVLQGRIGIVFYDMTTLYFETESEDDLRMIGYSKDGKHQHPQIMIGLLVSVNGLPIGYEIFQGNTSETKTLIPMLNVMIDRFEVDKPIIIADSALLSKSNLEALQEQGYEYILGGRIKNETKLVQQIILSKTIEESDPIGLPHPYGRLIVSYSSKRAAKDLFNRKRGLTRLEAKVKSGKLTKEAINNRGYNKYLKLEGQTKVKVDYEAFNQDKVWDGLKGYVTNTELSATEIIGAYQNLWHVEKAFRMSKSDLRFRPIYHYKVDRISAHILICFVSYAIYKELERLLHINNMNLSAEKAIAELKEIQELTYTLPKSKQVIHQLLELTQFQKSIILLFKS
jgi:transposase